MRTLLCAAACAAVLLAATVAPAANLLGLTEGPAELKSAGALAFGPDGVLFVGDAKGATVWAIDTGEKSGAAPGQAVAVPALDQKVAKLLGANAATINDLAASPFSGAIYLSVTAGNQPALVRVGSDGQLSQIDLKKVRHAKAVLADAPEDRVTGEGQRRRNLRDESITDVAWVDGRVLVAGLSNSSAPATVRALTFPFVETDAGAGIEFYHGAHGRYEDYAPVRAFVPFTIGGEPSLLAGFTCTPLVKFPINELAKGEKVRGVTVAELGNRNRPLSMIVYQKGDKNFLLIANSARGVMKVSTDDIERPSGITQRVADTAGQSYETIASLDGTMLLDRLDDSHAVVLIRSGDALDLRTVPLP